MSAGSKADATPRLGMLAWVGPGLIALLTLAIALSQPPLFEHWPNEGSVTFPMMYPGVFGFWIMLFYSPLLIGLLASLIGVFRAIAAASHRQEFRALMDLGAPRRGLVRHQTRLGLNHGAIAALTGAVLGAGIAQARSGLGSQFNSTTSWMLLTIFGLSIAATTLAYWVVARWITRGNRRAPSVYDVDAAMGVTSGPAPRSRLRRFAFPLALAAFVVVSALVTAHPTASSTVPSGLVTTWVIAYSWVGLLGIPYLIIWAGAKAATWLSRLAGRALLHGGNAARIAGDGLTRPTPARAVAIGAVGLVLGGTLAIGVMMNAVGARNDAVATLTPRLIISTVALPNRYSVTEQAPATTGWERRSIDPKLLASLRADDRFIVVPAGILEAGVDSVDRPDGDNLSHTTYLTISPADFDRVSAGSTKAMYFGDDVAMGGGPNPSMLTVGSTSTQVTVPNVGASFAALPRDWAESSFGSGPTSAVLLYDGPGGDAHSAIADFDVTGLHVQDLGATGTGSGPLNRVGVLAVSGSLLILAVGLVVALSLSVQRTRAHDYATMSALGASRSALRWGTAIESAVVTASGATVGVILGGAWGLWLAVSGDKVPWSLAWEGITFDLNHAPWGTVTCLALASIAAASIASVVARARLERLTPTEQLREAIKEGSL